MGSLAVAASASDDDAVAQVEFKVESNSIGIDADGSDGWSIDWDTTAIADGAYTLAATATDSALQSTTASVGITVDNIPPEPVSNIRVMDLDGSSADAGRGRWTATATIVIGDAGGTEIDGAFVEGSWGGGASGGDSCTTGADGSCQVSREVRNKFADATFSVIAVSHSSAIYDPGLNSDPDGDSDGTTLIIPKDGGGSEPPPPTGETMHIGNLSGSSASAPRNRWSASVDVAVHTSIASGDQPLPGMTVSGSWSSGGGGSCTTEVDGSCSITRNNIKGNVSATTFSVSGIVDPSASPVFAYAPGDNHDPDGDSDGTQIAIDKP